MALENICMSTAMYMMENGSTMCGMDLARTPMPTPAANTLDYGKRESGMGKES